MGVKVGEVSGSDNINKAVKNLIKVLFDETVKEIEKRNPQGISSDYMVLANINATTVQVIQQIAAIMMELQVGAVEEKMRLIMDEAFEDMK